MSRQWHHLSEDRSKGVEEQWQLRVDGRSVAVVRRQHCEYPRCDCVVHHHRGERRDDVECEAAHWMGLLITPSGMVMDVALLARGGVTAEQMRETVESAMTMEGWSL